MACVNKSSLHFHDVIYHQTSRYHSPNFRRYEIRTVLKTVSPPRTSFPYLQDQFSNESLFHTPYFHFYYDVPWRALSCIKMKEYLKNLIDNRYITLLLTIQHKITKKLKQVFNIQ